MPDCTLPGSVWRSMKDPDEYMKELRAATMINDFAPF